MKYCITMSVDGFYTIEGEASSKDEARKEAIQSYSDADFGELENVDMSIYSEEFSDEKV